MKMILALAAGIGLSAALIAHAATDKIDVVKGETLKLEDVNGVSLQGGGDLIIKKGSSYKFENTSSDSNWVLEYEDGGLKIKCPKPCEGNKDRRATVTLKELKDLSIFGGGKVDVRGNFDDADEFNVVIMGGGYIDADDIPASKVNVVITGGGNISVYAKDELDVAIIGGGKVTYKGSPTIDKSIIGGGMVSKD